MTTSPRYPSSNLARAARTLFVAGASATILAGSAHAAPAGASDAPEPTTVTVQSPLADATATAARAQDAGGAQDNAAVLNFFRKVEFSGLVDAYYTYNFNEPTTGTFTPLRNFDVRHNQFSVALVELALSKPVAADDRVGFRFDLNYGQVAQLFNSDPLDNNALVNVQQAYVSYLAPVGSGLTFEVGKFVTPVGFEPTESNLNYNYSRAFSYALGPYYHVGARIGYAPSDKVALGAMLVNGWSGQSGDNNAGKTVGASLTVKPTGKLTLIENLLFGPEQDGNTEDKRLFSNTNLAFAASDKVGTGVDFYYAKDTLDGDDVSWKSVALYLRGQLTPVFAVAPRFEVFDDGAGIVSGAVQNLKEFTLTGEFKHSDGLLFRLEYRRDWSDIDFFEKDGDATDNQNTVTFGFVYSFTSK